MRVHANVAVGRMGKAFAWLERARAEDDALLPMVKVDADLVLPRSDQHFAAVADRIANGRITLDIELIPASTHG
jgi:hypothetical protein